ncbi:hypothetical protein V5P93_005103 [Actinokineospora auranticolor]|uniref:hypothetical protein n=1 Tax=Actinokineospora auranticolor TaxID=155976 RepID=UPI001CA4CBF9|nr:hypothetical protein [Actinokineospora auranticolor]
MTPASRARATSLAWSAEFSSRARARANASAVRTAKYTTGPGRASCQHTAAATSAAAT